LALIRFVHAPKFVQVKFFAYFFLATPSSTYFWNCFLSLFFNILIAKNSLCHPAGTVTSNNERMSNATKIRAFCSNNCGRRVGKFNRLFCSSNCRWSFDRSAVIESFVAGTHQPTFIINKVLRRYLIEKGGECCQRCGWAVRHAKTGRVPLEIEHIDGNWRNVVESNLTVLCPNCHALTPTFRGLNRGHGRPGRPGLRAKTEPEAITSPPKRGSKLREELSLFDCNLASEM
jgi:hypothetical protein